MNKEEFAALLVNNGWKQEESNPGASFTFYVRRNRHKIASSFIFLYENNFSISSFETRQSVKLSKKNFDLLLELINLNDRFEVSDE